MPDPNKPIDDKLLSDALAEIKAMGKEGAAHPSTKPVLVGAGVGAVAGLVAGTVLPIVSWPIGLVAGAGFMLYKRLRP
jgi:ammonia channel protein AmtB